MNPPGGEGSNLFKSPLRHGSNVRSNRTRVVVTRPKRSQCTGLDAILRRVNWQSTPLLGGPNRVEGLDAISCWNATTCFALASTALVSCRNGVLA